MKSTKGPNVEIVEGVGVEWGAWHITYLDG